jgi:hypothetical protein
MEFQNWLSKIVWKNLETHAHLFFKLYQINQERHLIISILDHLGNIRSLELTRAVLYLAGFFSFETALKTSIFESMTTYVRKYSKPKLGQF